MSVPFRCNAWGMMRTGQNAPRSAAAPQAFLSFLPPLFGGGNVLAPTRFGKGIAVLALYSFGFYICLYLLVSTRIYLYLLVSTCIYLYLLVSTRICLYLLVSSRIQLELRARIRHVRYRVRSTSLKGETV